MMPAVTQPSFVIALDVGTSSTRALLFDTTGTAVPGVLSQKRYSLTTSSSGEVSVAAHQLVEVVVQTIQDVLQQAGQCRIVGVALDTFWHSLLGIDASGCPVTAVITWEDTRAYQAALELRTLLDEQMFHQRTGVRFHASYWPAKLRWLLQSNPATFQRVACWISFGEYLHRQLLGRSVCTLSMASATGLLHIAERQWDEDLIRHVGLSRDQLPALGDMRDSLTGLTPRYAQLFPQLQDVPWFPASGDGAAACVGSGCMNPQNWSMTIGTSSALRVVVPPERVNLPSGLWLYLIDARRAVVGGALSEGGNLLEWLCQMLHVSSLRDVEADVAALAPDSHGLTFLPFLSGERSPGWHAEARMTIAGLGLHTSPHEILRAAMEALAYQLYAVYTQLTQALDIQSHDHRIIASGGALLHSTILSQIISDTLGVPLYPSREHEASARGAALLALEALGLLPDLATMMPAALEPITPDATVRERYHNAAHRQFDLYQKLLGDQ